MAMRTTRKILQETTTRPSNLDLEKDTRKKSDLIVYLQHLNSKSFFSINSFNYFLLFNLIDLYKAK